MHGVTTGGEILVVLLLLLQATPSDSDPDMAMVNVGGSMVDGGLGFEKERREAARVER